MRQKESDVPASVCMVNTAIWVSMQYSSRLKWWARRDWILLLYQEVYRQQSRTHRSAVMFLMPQYWGQRRQILLGDTGQLTP